MRQRISRRHDAQGRGQNVCVEHSAFFDATPAFRLDPDRFRAPFMMSDAPMPITSVPERIADIQSRPAWDGASIVPADDDYPRVHLDWHEAAGFVFQCYEHEESWSDFLVTSRTFSTPSVEIELGGQALERWPRELFVSAERAAQALNHFLERGKQDPSLEWVRIDRFPRETVWEGRDQQKAWERANPRKKCALRAKCLADPAMDVHLDVPEGLARQLASDSKDLASPSRHSRPKVSGPESCRCFRRANSSACSRDTRWTAF